MTDEQLQSLRNLGNEAEEAADEIYRLRARVLELEAVHEYQMRAYAAQAVAAERERCAELARSQPGRFASFADADRFALIVLAEP